MYLNTSEPTYSKKHNICGIFVQKEADTIVSSSATQAATISSLSIFGSPVDEECLPIPVAPRSSSSDELRVWRLTSQGLVEVDANTMGQFLDKPKTEKTCFNGEGNSLRYGVSSMQGWRMCMEDAHTTETVMSKDGPFKEWSFFAVFDGHGGDQIANKASELLLSHLMKTNEFKELTKLLEENNGTVTQKCIELIEAGMKSGFMEFDSDVKQNAEGNSGSTAVCSIITPTHIVIANLGDSRAVISSNSEPLFGTVDHKPYHDKERARILDAGGQVMIQRINGALAVSRSFGDYDYKDHPMLPADQQLVSPMPDTYVHVRNKDNDEFMFLACDGIYDVMENHEVADFVRSRLKVDSDLSKICNDVLDECFVKGSRDNMTMIIIAFPGAPAADKKLQEQEKEWMDKLLAAAEEVTDEYVKNEDGDSDTVHLYLVMEQVEKRIGKLEGIPNHTIRTCCSQMLTKKNIEFVWTC